MPRTEIVIFAENLKANINNIDDVLSAEGITYDHENGSNIFYIEEDTCTKTMDEVSSLLTAENATFTISREVTPAEDRTQDWYGRSADTEEWHG